MSRGGTSSEGASLLGQVVADRYFVESRLGEGGMGTVYRARHVQLDKRVALKVLHGEYSRSEELVQRFLQEAKAASRIRNEHVIDITDFGVTATGNVFFAMEFLEGRDLHDLMKDFLEVDMLLPWSRARSIFLQVCSALAAAHRCNIIHRDLKPENIFLVEGKGHEDYVKLLDFGIAKMDGLGDEEDGARLTKQGLVMGTPEYMAPEQARGLVPDHRVDVYAMGCLLYQLLTGRLPFQGETFMDVLTQHMTELPPPVEADTLELSGAPESILWIVDCAMAKEPKRRFSTIEALADAVRETSEHGSVDLALPHIDDDDPYGAALPDDEPQFTGGPRQSIQEAWTGAVRGVGDLEHEELPFDPGADTQGRPPMLWIGAGLIAVVLGVGVWKVASGGDTAPADDTASESVEGTIDGEELVEPAADDTAEPASGRATKERGANDRPARDVAPKDTDKGGARQESAETKSSSSSSSSRSKAGRKSDDKEVEARMAEILRGSSSGDSDDSDQGEEQPASENPESGASASKGDGAAKGDTPEASEGAGSDGAKESEAAKDEAGSKDSKDSEAAPKGGSASAGEKGASGETLGDPEIKEFPGG